MKKKQSKINYADHQAMPSARVAEEPPAAVKESAIEIGAFAAKTHLSAILSKVTQGQTFYITKHGKRIAEIKPITRVAGKPAMAPPGFAKGKFWMAPDFDAPLDDFKEYME